LDYALFAVFPGLPVRVRRHSADTDIESSCADNARITPSVGFVCKSYFTD
jgi:hypothetical protein